MKKIIFILFLLLMPIVFGEEVVVDEFVIRCSSGGGCEMEDSVEDVYSSSPQQNSIKKVLKVVLVVILVLLIFCGLIIGLNGDGNSVKFVKGLRRIKWF